MLAYFVDNFDPFIFRLWDNVGPRWYGFAYVLAFISAYFIVRLLSKRGYCDLSAEQVSDFITWTALFGVLLGGRIGYVLFYKPEMLREPLSILRVWEGGMASHGGMIGILALTFYYARRHKLIWTNLGDALVVAAPIGLFFGRCANFINGELYGRATNVSWAMQFPKELIENRALGDRAVAVAQNLDPSLIAPEQIIEAARHNPQL
jgi:phosphatidylglycerol---prolipoprotein diacylglyceryl transferase